MFGKGVRGRVMLGTFLNCFQQLSGIDFVLFYAPTLFAQAGLSGNFGAFIASGVTGLVLVFATLCGTLWVDKLSRRTIVISGGASVSFAMIMIGILYGTGAAYGRVGKWSVGWAGLGDCVGSSWRVEADFDVSRIRQVRDSPD